jgi:two-component system, cell cycle response regulator DivK
MNKIVLVVDDSPANLKLIRVLLTVEGYQVLTAADAESALSILADVRPGLILMDIQLPGMDGLRLTRQLKSDPKTGDIPIIAITSFAMKGDEVKAREAGCDAYITKPIDTRALPGQVAQYFTDR